MENVQTITAVYDNGVLKPLMEQPLPMRKGYVSITFKEESKEAFNRDEMLTATRDIFMQFDETGEKPEKYPLERA